MEGQRTHTKWSAFTGKAFRPSGVRGDRAQHGHMLVAACGPRTSRMGRAWGGLPCPCLPWGHEWSQWKPRPGYEGTAGLSRLETRPSQGLTLKTANSSPKEPPQEGVSSGHPACGHGPSPLCGDLGSGAAAGGKTTCYPQCHTRSPCHMSLLLEARRPGPALPPASPGWSTRSLALVLGPPLGRPLGRSALLLIPGVGHPGKTLLPPGPL